MAVVGAILGIAIGAGIGLVLIWLVTAPFRAAKYVGREVRARDVRNRQTLAGEFTESDHERARRAGRAAMQRLAQEERDS